MTPQKQRLLQSKFQLSLDDFLSLLFNEYIEVPTNHTYTLHAPKEIIFRCPEAMESDFKLDFIKTKLSPANQHKAHFVSAKGLFVTYLLVSSGSDGYVYPGN